LPTQSFDLVEYPEPHLERTRKILERHPQLRRLFGPVPATSLWVFVLVGLQIGVAYALRGVPFWALLLVAYVVGAVANHALWVLIHESTHNLIFRSSRANSLLQIFANGPIVFPSAISFRKYHLLHHRFQGDPEVDADLASPFEARLVGNSALGKSLWLLTFFLWQALRVPRLKRVQLFDGWYALNVAWQVAFLTGVWLLAGWSGVIYLCLSCVFSIGLHPLGARWIQEHYLTHPGQETFSYYGPANALAFNVGYHNEHHDLMMVPWMRLPQVCEEAREFYDSLHSHQSWTRLVLRFIFDPSLSLYSRRIRRAQRAPGRVQVPVPEPMPAPAVAATSAVEIAVEAQAVFSAPEAPRA
jgi:sphingolipid delta-4 desaturase